jgi:mycothiol maleylpyruvate isomerase-like protein
MNDTEYIALVDTTRDELRERISQARQRFNRLARSANPLARPPDSGWTVQQVVAHVLTIAHRYRDLARTGDYHRAATPRELVAINQTDLEAAMAPIPDLADQLQVLEPEIDNFFDAITNDGPVHRFHWGPHVDGITAQTNWLGELLLHGQDIARAVKAPWELTERDMLLVLRGAMQIGPGYLRAGVSPDTDVCVAFRLAGARPYLIHIHDSTAEFREYRPGDRPDAVLRLPASTLTQLFYQRIGPFTAARRGLRIVGGRRPWLALKLMSYFEPA